MLYLLFSTYGLTISKFVECGIAGVCISLIPDSPNFYHNTILIASVVELRERILSYNCTYNCTIPHF